MLKCKASILSLKAEIMKALKKAKSIDWDLADSSQDSRSEDGETLRATVLI